MVMLWLPNFFNHGIILSTELLRNEFDFWNVHGIMNTSGLLQSEAQRASQLCKTRSIPDSMNLPKI